MLEKFIQIEKIKKICRSTKIDFLRKQNVENFMFLVQMFYNPVCYLASIML